MASPTSGKYLVKLLTDGADVLPKLIQRTELIGAGPVTFTQGASGSTLNVTQTAPNPYAYGFILRT